MSILTNTSEPGTNSQLFLSISRGIVSKQKPPIPTTKTALSKLTTNAYETESNTSPLAKPSQILKIRKRPTPNSKSSSSKPWTSPLTTGLWDSTRTTLMLLWAAPITNIYGSFRELLSWTRPSIRASTRTWRRMGSMFKSSRELNRSDDVWIMLD